MKKTIKYILAFRCFVHFKFVSWSLIQTSLNVLLTIFIRVDKTSHNSLEPTTLFLPHPEAYTQPYSYLTQKHTPNLIPTSPRSIHPTLFLPHPEAYTQSYSYLTQKHTSNLIPTSPRIIHQPYSYLTQKHTPNLIPTSPRSIHPTFWPSLAYVVTPIKLQIMKIWLCLLKFTS